MEVECFFMDEYCFFFKVVAYVFSLVLGLFGAGFLSPVSVE